MSKLIDQAVKALYTELKEQVYVGEFYSVGTCVDGDVCLEDAVRVVLKAIRNPTVEMEIAAGRDNERGDHLAPRHAWQAMIDEALK